MEDTPAQPEAAQISHTMQVEASGSSVVYTAMRDIIINQPPRDGGEVPVRLPARIRLFMVAPFLLLIAGAALLVRGYTASPGSARLASLLVGAGAAALAGPLFRVAWRQWQIVRLRHSPRLARRLERQLDGAAQQLVAELKARWEREATLRGLHHPHPLQVEWVNADALADHWSVVLGASGNAGPLDLSGRFDSIADVYAEVPSGRLLVLGGAGAGKSVLALRFTLGRLSRVDADRSIPVLLPLASWDPATSDLRTWALGRLVMDHPALAARALSGESVAYELMRSKRLLLVLDGFDEMRSDARPEALRRLRDELGPEDSLLLTSRVGEYEAAVRAAGSVLPAAAAIRLMPLGLGELTEYLRHSVPPLPEGSGEAAKWDPVLARLAGDQADPHVSKLRSVLSTPLMASLAGNAYRGASGDPAELLDTDRFPTGSAVEEHLLDQLMPTLTGQPDRRIGWLILLARQLTVEGTQDLVWWRLSPATSAFVRVFGATLALGATSGLMYWLFDRPTSWFGIEVPAWAAYTLLCLLSWGDVVARARAEVPAPRTFGPLRTVPTPRILLGVLLFAVVLSPWAALAFGFDIGDGLLVPLALPFVASALGSVLNRSRVRRVAETSTPPAPEPVQSAFDHYTSGIADSDPARALRADRAATLLTLGLINLVTGGSALWRAAWLIVLPVLILRSSAEVSGLDGVGAAEWTVVAAVVVVALAVTGISSSAWAVFAASRLWFWCTGQLPWKILDFLAEAHRSGILRQSGSVYQFRHSRLQERLVASLVVQPVPRGAASGRRRIFRGARAPRGTRFATVALILVGTGAVWWNIGHLGAATAGAEGRSGAEVGHACTLLRPKDLTGAVPDAVESYRDAYGTAHRNVTTCAWSPRVSGGSAENVSLQAEVYGPDMGRSAEDVARTYFTTSSGAGSSAGLRHPTGLGDEAVTFTEFVGHHPFVKTVVRVDNVLITVGYDTDVVREDEETYARLDRVTQDLARTVVLRLGP